MVIVMLMQKFILCMYAFKCQLKLRELSVNEQNKLRNVKH